MNRFIRSAVGILGSALALLMYGSPIGTFRKVIHNKTTGDLSGIPYAVGLFNCLVYTLYGSPLISNGWDNAIVMGVNITGFLIECFYLVIYLLFAPSKSKIKMAASVAGVLIVFGSIATVSLWGIHDHGNRKLLVGTTGMVSTIILYLSPLSDIRMVLKTKSVEFVSFYFSLFAFLGCVLWLVYGALSHDILIMAPNCVGIPLASVQMIIYCIFNYREQKKRARVEVEDGEMQVAEIEIDVEKATGKTEKTVKRVASNDIEIQLQVEYELPSPPRHKIDIASRY